MQPATAIASVCTGDGPFLPSPSTVISLFGVVDTAVNCRLPVQVRSTMVGGLAGTRRFYRFTPHPDDPGRHGMCGPEGMSRILISTLALVLAVRLCAADGQTVATRMRNVVFHLGHGVALRVDDLEGQLV